VPCGITLRQELSETRRERHAKEEEGDVEKRLGQEGEESQTGDRHRTVGGAREGREGSPQEILVEEELLEEEVDVEETVLVEEALFEEALAVKIAR